MAANDTRTNDVLHNGKTAAAVWGVPLAIGVMLAALGTIALVAASATGVVTTVLLGSLLLAGGVLEIVFAFKAHKSGHFLLYLLAGVLSGVTGILFMARPTLGMMSLTLMLAAFFFANGLFHGITAVMHRYAYWGWDLAYGIAAIILGVMLFQGWPAISLWFVGMLVGVELIIRGITLMSVGLALRRGVRAVTV
jgi:uncharacterized membrane protein HdeD (DUF308 family)